ncbi:NAD(P)H-binding protein [Actinophytocola sp. NPDC049390]|uniref:NAD(P)H-binding protein n=1 Tax=Actinophytocola sp. NPDC049390 TaxID=3363894 RepID=UPI00378D7BF1
MTILVTGATGNVGRHVVAGLTATGEPVRAVTRTPSKVPEGVEVARGDIADLGSMLDGVDRVFLLWPHMTADGADAVVSALASRVSHVVFLSARGVTDDSPLFHARIERLLRDSGVGWTFLRAGGFATNTLEWAPQVRTGVVRWVHGGAGRSLIHERDIADVAVEALTSSAHAGAAYELTGPETLTQVEQVRTLGAAVGREVRWEEMPVAEARESLLAQGWDPEFADNGLAYWATLVDRPETVTGVVEEITGKPGRRFAEWAVEHAADFR